MQKVTLGEAKEKLKSIAGETGYSIDDPRLTAAINDAQEELMGIGDFPGVVDRYAIKVKNKKFTLPFFLQRVTGLIDRGNPTEIRSSWFEFLQHGPGPAETSSINIDKLIDREDTPTITDCPETSGPYQIKVVGEIDERVNAVRPKIIIKGYDENGDWIRTDEGGEQVDGEYIEINGDTGPFEVNSVNNFCQITEVIKPETKGFVKIYAYDTALTEADLLLGDYWPQQTNCTFKQYYLASLPDDEETTLTIRAKKRFTKLVNDNDYLHVGNMPAMRLMVLAQKKLLNQEDDEYLNKRSIIRSLLAEEAKDYNGKSPVPSLTFTEGFGMGAIEDLR